MNMAEAAPNPNPAPGEEFLTSVPDSWRSALVQRSSSERRITVMEDSLRCHAYGWLSLVPLAGIGFVVLAVRMFRRVDRERSEWNPAQHLWLRGLVLACFGFWTSRPSASIPPQPRCSSRFCAPIWGRAAAR